MNTIISVGVGRWHPKGVLRLSESLRDVGWGGSTRFWYNEYPDNCPTHQEMPYAFKVYAVEEAHRNGARFILWCDSSVWAIKNPEPIFAKIQDQGYWFWKTGYYSDAWCNDAILKAHNITREQAHDIDMISASIMGFDMEHPKTKEFMLRWRKDCDAGLFAGPWIKQSGDPELPPYMGHRHDQSSASLIIHELGLDVEMWGENAQYWEPDESKIKPGVKLILAGM